jgi:hypothetical protein
VRELRRFGSVLLSLWGLVAAPLIVLGVLYLVRR